MKSIKIFESKKIRSSWDNEQGKWYFSIVDIIEVLTDSPRPRKYWSALKSKLQAEGSELSHKLGQLKMRAEDGKIRLTDVADTEQLFRLIQSIPSPKAELFKHAKKGGEIAGDTRKQIEKQTGKDIVSKQNAKLLKEGKGNKKISE